MEAAPAPGSRSYHAKRRFEQKQALLKLEQHRDSLQEQLQSLQQQQESLQQQNGIVAALCDSLLHVLPKNKQKQQSAGHKKHHQRQHGTSSSNLVQLQAAEGQLLESLQALMPSSLLQPAGEDGQGFPTICPPNNPTALFNDMMSRPIMEEARSITSQGLTAMYQNLLSGLALRLQLFDASLIEAAACEEWVRLSACRLLHCIVSCQRLGKAAMLKPGSIADADALADPEAAAAAVRHTPNMAVVVTKLQLTPAQQQAISDHWGVWRGLMAPLDAEISQLQQQMQEQGLGLGDTDIVTASSNSCSMAIMTNCDSRSAPAASAASACSSAEAAAAASVPDRAALLESQLQLVDRLQVVMNKKLLVHLACVCFFVGRLTWVQYSRLLVLSWPCVVSFELSCQAVAQMEAQSHQPQHVRVQGAPPRQQQQQQQQQQEKEKDGAHGQQQAVK